MQVIGQHKQEQCSGRYVKKPRPLRQTKVIRFSQRQSNEHRQKRNKQHGQIVQIPEISHQPYTFIQRIPNCPDCYPKYHQHRNRSEIAAHLWLNDPPVQGNAPSDKQFNVYGRANHTAKPVQWGVCPTSNLPQHHRCKNSKGYI